jgi:hypothetical protein
LGRCEEFVFGVVRRYGQDLGFACVEKYPQGWAELLKCLDKKRKVFIRKEGKRIVKIGVSGAFGATAVVTHIVMGTAGLCSSAEFVVDWAEDAINDETCKSGGERVALGEPIFLGKKIQGAVRSMKEAAIRVFIH